MLTRTFTIRLGYRYGFPFITSVVLAIVTAAWPHIREARFHEGTSIWTFAILTTISTAFVLLCGGPFRTFFIVIAVTPPFLLVLPGWLDSMIAHPEYPIRGFVEYLLYFVATPILLVWIAAKLLKRKAHSP
jgi:hypothetical protein